MDKIMEIFNNLDKLSEKMPKLDSVMDWVLKLTTLAVRVGPICILVLGLIYLLIPPKEANHKAGYRTFFGMGSIGAWRFTQFVSGLIMTLVGLVLTTIANKAAKGFADLDPNAMMDAAFGLIKGQIICAVAIFVLMIVLTTLMFTVKGDLRFKVLRGTLLDKVLFDDHPMHLILKTFGLKSKRRDKPSMKRENPLKAEDPQSLPAPEAEQEQQYERQGEQKITADDIVIEGL